MKTEIKPQSTPLTTTPSLPAAAPHTTTLLNHLQNLDAALKLYIPVLLSIFDTLTPILQAAVFGGVVLLMVVVLPLVGWMAGRG
jgi:hypothetical protein